MTPEHDLCGTVESLRARPVTIDAHMRAAIGKLQAAHIANAPLLASRIMAAATGLSQEQLLMRANEPIAAAAADAANRILDRACNFEPISRILNEREFFGRTFKLNEATLDPRPDSETLIEAALELANEFGWREQAIRILDVGTGTGCLAITLLAELPNARALATDISDLALEAARENAHRLGVSDRTSFANHDGLKTIEATFDLVISNPPYIPTAGIETLAAEVRNFDPHVALDGGHGGLKFYKAIAANLTRVVPDGWVLLEVGAGQARDVLNMLDAEAISELRTWADLLGHSRCVAARTHCA